MSTTISNIFTINGVIDTTKSVMDNLNTLATACSTWLTFDIHTGKWSVVVNEPGSSVADFDDSNIIGGITVTGTSISSLYNKVQLEFPHKDLNDQVDVITYEIPAEQRYSYEYDNILNVQIDCVNDPIQAEYLAAIQLKQNRVDQMIQFRTDFSMLGLKAGDIINVTNSMYGYTNKPFRVLNITEEDADDHTIQLSINAFEYDSNVYSTSGLVRTARSTQNGIIGNCLNQTTAASDQASNEVSIMKLLTPLALSSLFNMMFPKLNKKLFEALSAPKSTITASSSEICENATTIITVAVCCSTCNDLSGVEVAYEITGVDAEDINVPLTGNITVNGSGVGTLSITATSDAAAEGTETLVFTAGGASKTIKINDRKTYSMVASPASIPEGGSSTVTITTVGIPDGTNKPFTISGTGVDQLSGTPTSGSVTINGNTATINVVTKSIATLTDTSLTIAFDPGVYYCSGSSINIAITHTGVPPEPPEPTYFCEWVTIPADWCGSFNAAGEALTVFPTSTITVLKAIDGQPKITVPLTASVSGGVITILTTADIDANTSKGGKLANIITSFNTMTTGVKRVTGTTTQVVGH